MNKSELVDALAAVHFDGNRQQARHALDAVTEVITHSLVVEDRVLILGFGTFERKTRPERFVINPETGRRKKIKSVHVPAFRPGAVLKAYVSGAKKLPRRRGSGKTPRTQQQPESAVSPGQASGPVSGRRDKPPMTTTEPGGAAGVQPEELAR